MKFNILEYSKLLAKHNIRIIYSGPLWAEGINGMAEFLQKRLDMDNMPLSASQAVFSIFVEQMNNMLMYSAEKEMHESHETGISEMSSGIFVLGSQDKSYYIQTGNVIKNGSVGILKERIDFLNTLDKKELRQFYKEQIKTENDNPESKGAGLGLTEIARRATSKIEYEFIPYGEGLSYFTMYVTV
ncbi:MAG: SiaB family protein kinase [Treponema sp.]|nr:SiaB family protein kinase [Treponema sp.]